MDPLLINTAHFVDVVITDAAVLRGCFRNKKLDLSDSKIQGVGLRALSLLFMGVSTFSLLRKVSFPVLISSSLYALTAVISHDLFWATQSPSLKQYMLEEASAKKLYRFLLPSV